MSLSFLGRFTLFLVLALMSAWAGREYALPLANYLAEAQDSTARDTKISGRSLAYRVPADRPLTFAFSQPVDLAKILVHPAVGEADRAKAEGFVYGLRIRWLDAAGAELAAYDQFLQADAPDAVFVSGKNWRFFRTRPELIAEQDQIITESPAPAARLEIEIIDADPAIVGVDLRLYERQPFMGANATAAFERLSEQDKAWLAEANAFPADMLSRSEKFYLGLNAWKPVGPLGIAGRDYEGLVLYEAKLTASEKAAGGVQ